MASILLSSYYTGWGFFEFFSSFCVLGWDYDNIGASPSWTVRRYVATARFNFFLTSNDSSNWAPEFSEIYPHDYFLTIVTCIGMYFRALIANFADGLILSSCLLLWVNVSGFRKLLQEDEKKGGVYSSREILKHYGTLKELADIINSVTSSLVLALMAQRLFVYSVFLNSIFIASNYLEKFSLIFDFLYVAAVFFLAGHICREMKYLVKWLSRRERI